MCYNHVKPSLDLFWATTFTALTWRIHNFVSYLVANPIECDYLPFRGCLYRRCGLAREASRLPGGFVQPMATRRSWSLLPQAIFSCRRGGAELPAITVRVFWEGATPAY